MSTTDFAMLVIALICAGAFVLTLKDGETSFSLGVHVSRKRNPLAYWTIQSFFGLLIAVLLVVAIARIFQS